jgi:uncharacterized membrane protein YphA (DoxX/SURF4 family)
VSNDQFEPTELSTSQPSGGQGRPAPSPGLPVVDLTASTLRPTPPAPAVMQVQPAPAPAPAAFPASAHSPIPEGQSGRLRGEGTPLIPPERPSRAWDPIAPTIIPAASVPSPVELTDPDSNAATEQAGGLLTATASNSFGTPPGATSSDGAAVSPLTPEQAAQAAQVAHSEARSARARALGEIAVGPDVVTAPSVIGLPTTYNKFPSLVLLVLRLIVAALMGIRCFRDADALSATTRLWENTVLPSAEILAWVQIAAEGAIALLLLFGLGTRVVGLLLMILSVAWLTFVLWGAVSPFHAGVPGFTGEFEILLVGVGFVFLGVGGGGWLSLDGFFHRARVERKNNRSS